MLDELSTCPLVLNEIHGGGREAYMEGKTILEMGCTTGMPAIYGGSENADVGSDITLTLTSGHFDKVFGGGNGEHAIMVGNPTVDINVTKGWINGQYIGTVQEYSQYNGTRRNCPRTE